jgi:hypothetical protein
LLIPGTIRVLRRLGRKLQNRLDYWLVDGSVPSTQWGKRILTPVLVRARLLLVFLLDGRHGEAQIWEGLEIHSGRSMRVAYLADQRSMQVASPEYLQSILFQPDTVQTFPAGKFSMLRVQAYARELAGRADLVIVEANSLLRFYPPGSVQNFWWIVSPLVRMVMDFLPGQTWAEIEQGMHAQRKNLNLVFRPNSRFNGALRISHAEEDFDLFYERMHVPLLKERHGAQAQVETKDGLRDLFHKGMLMLILHEGQPVAGALNTIHGKTLFGVGLGVLDGDQRWYAMGVMTLLYYHSIRWCFENGIRRLDFGGVHPFLKDGLYDYKRRWGFQPYHDPLIEREWLFWAPSASEPVAAWINAHPFLLPIETSDNTLRKPLKTELEN